MISLDQIDHHPTPKDPTVTEFYDQDADRDAIPAYDPRAEAYRRSDVVAQLFTPAAS